MTKEEKREKLEFKMIDFIESECWVTCSKCSYTNNFYGAEPWDIVGKIIDEGWHATDQNVYCPSCQIRRKK